jgi:large subunit ribosomal protein L37e
VHTTCRRCGRKTYHIQNKRCGACGYPAKTTRRYDGWAPKVRARKGQGTGRMSHLKTVGRRAKNNFREENNFVKASTSKKNAGTRGNKLVKAKIPRRRLI